VLARLREGGMSLLLSEQNVALAAELSDRAYVMALGRVVHEIGRGEWDGFRSNEALLRAYLGGERQDTH
jgi:ABC-type branched-subunit amino acid transport system ATPase component